MGHLLRAGDLDTTTTLYSLSKLGRFALRSPSVSTPQIFTHEDNRSIELEDLVTHRCRHTFWALVQGAPDRLPSLPHLCLVYSQDHIYQGCSLHQRILCGRSKSTPCRPVAGHLHVRLHQGGTQEEEAGLVASAERQGFQNWNLASVVLDLQGLQENLVIRQSRELPVPCEPSSLATVWTTPSYAGQA